jgi:hypothetical protein
LVMALVQNYQPVHVSIRRQQYRTGRGDFPIRTGAFTELPYATLRDPDIEGLVPVEIEVPCDLPSRFDGDGVFFGAASEDNCDP